jgi:glutaminyl-tRNA synthetase
MSDNSTETDKFASNFIHHKINEDLKSNKHGGKVITRFPPEPNGYLHIGHAKSICLNFGIAENYDNARCHLRFDDTNPAKEDVEYVDSIMEDIKWLGFNWGDHLYHASDYFDKLYSYAVKLIKDGKAFVCSLSHEKMREYRGTLTEPGKNSPDRDRSISENLDMFEKMKNGEYEDGRYTLRAKIDMASPNMNMRDPAIYRIKRAHHQRTGDKWCIYPMYDFAHGLSDAIEGITHSLCSIEFDDHRALYDWFLEAVNTENRPQQIEFARLNLDYTILSKRYLLQLVENKQVSGWDDPRMPTVSGMRRRGITPESIRTFCDTIGVGRSDSSVEMEMFEACIRDNLNVITPRVMTVLDPIKVVIENYPEDQVEEIEAPYHPADDSFGSRKIYFSRELYIERADFMENPPKKFFRLGPGREVRLRYGYFLKCNEVVKSDSGEIIELKCTYDPETKGGKAPDGRKVKATMHWVSAKHAVPVEVRLYDRLFTVANPSNTSEGKEIKDYLNPDSLKVLTNSFAEASIKTAKPGERFQFERQAYFSVDPKDSTKDRLVFNRIVTLRDAWAKAKKKG